MKISLTRLRTRLVILFCLLTVLLSDYNIAGIRAVFIFASLSIIVGCEYVLKKSMLGKLILLDCIVVVLTLPALLNPWFSFVEFFKSFMNLNLLLLFAMVTYNVIRRNCEIAVAFMKYALIALIFLTFYQTILYYATGAYNQIQFGILRCNDIFEKWHVFRGGVFRPYGIFTESGHLAITIFALMMCLLQQEIVDIRIFFGSILAMILTFSLSGFLAVVILCFYTLLCISKGLFDRKFKTYIYIILAIGTLGTMVFVLRGANGLIENSSIQIVLNRIPAFFQGKDESGIFRYFTGFKLVKRALSENFLIGAGLGQNTTMAAYMDTGLSGRVNMFYYEILIYFGTVGLALFAVLFLRVNLRRKVKLGSLLFFLYLSITQSGVLYIYTYSLYTFIVALEDSRESIAS